MADVRVTNTRQIQGGSLTVADLRNLIDGVDGACTLTIKHYSGDQREPGYDSITINNVREQRITRSSPDGRPFETL